MSEETMSVERSEENGNVPLETPSEQPVETTAPVEVKEETAQSAEPTEPQLYELPDGRKVDGATLTKEWKQNFLPDYTKKSQELSKLKEPNNKPNETTEDPYATPDYTPGTYREVIDRAKQEAIEEIKKERQAEIDNQKAFEDNISNQISELKTTDPNLNVDALFHHSNTYFAKYGVKFPDLKSAYTHMKDVAELTKTVQQTTVKNIAKRNDPVSANQGKANGVAPQRGQFTHARDFLNAIGGNQ